MSERYYRDINTNKDIVKFKLQLGAILLKLKEHNLNISNIEDSITKINNDNKSIDNNITKMNNDNKNINSNITKINTDIKNNDSDIKSNYDLCVPCKNDLISIDKRVYAINNDITNLNSDIEGINSNITNINCDIENIEENNKNIIKHNYAIKNTWLYNIDILNTYTITPSKPVISLFEYVIEGKFITNSILEISCKLMYKYGNCNEIGLLRHTYSLLDDNDNLIHTHGIIHINAGDNLANHLNMNDDFHILFKNSPTDKMKIVLQVAKVDVSKSGSISFRIMNPYNNNILCVKHIKYLSEK